MIVNYNVFNDFPLHSDRFKINSDDNFDGGRCGGEGKEGCHSHFVIPVFRTRRSAVKQKADGFKQIKK